MRISTMVALAAAAGLTTSALGQIFPELEPNDSKATANAFTLDPGDGVTGNSITGTLTGLDYFRLTTAAAPLGIYRYRMVLNNSLNAATIRGLNQIAAAAGPWPGPVGTAGTTDSTIQTAFIPVGTATRISQWYGFGRQEEVYYRVTGAVASTADYTSVLERQAVVPTAIGGSFNAGPITITTIAQGHTSDTDLWIYDSNFDPIVGYGNDDESINGGGAGTTLQSLLTRTYAPGTYYLAMSLFQMANNQGSPSDDDFRTGLMMDFANIVANSSTSTIASMTFTISDGVNSLQVANTHAGQFDVNWFSFTVIPTPGPLALFGLAGLVLARRRR